MRPAAEPTLDLASRPRPAPGLDTVSIDGQELLFDGNQLRLLAGPAALIWRRVDGLSCVGAIATGIAADFDEEQSGDVRADVLRFLAELLDQGLLELEPPGRSDHYVCPAHVGYVEGATGTLLVDLSTGRRRGLSPSGSRIWQLICAGAGSEQVVDVLRSEFPDAPASLEHDVIVLLEELVAAGLLRRAADVVQGVD